MKKNVMMRVASALGVAALLTTCVISGTYAKYTTSGSGSSAARVAKWGFEHTGELTITDLFKHEDASVAGPITDSEGKVTHLIAPGTTNNVDFTFVYDAASNGNIKAPEVAYTFEVSTATSECADAIKNNPNIKWYLDNKLAPASGSATEGSWDALLLAIDALDGNKTGNQYAQGTLPEAFYGTEGDTANPFDANKKHNVKWVWWFDKDSDTNATDNDVDTNKTDSTDTSDTTMGNADTLATVKLVITITATQVD